MKLFAIFGFVAATPVVQKPCDDLLNQCFFDFTMDGCDPLPWCDDNGLFFQGKTYLNSLSRSFIIQCL